MLKTKTLQSKAFAHPFHYWVIKCVLTASLMTPTPAQAGPEEIDKLTQQWLNIEAQTRQIEDDWRGQQPVLHQRVSLLRAEKKQLETILQENESTQSGVDEKRASLLAEQESLERQQAALQTALTLASSRIDALYAFLPPVLTEQWQQEDSLLGLEPQSSMQLQVALAKLSLLEEFNQRVTVNETRVRAPDTTEVLVKQLYLGAGMAWFTNISGSITGWGHAGPEGWEWHFDSKINGDDVNKAIAIFEKRSQADFVELPFALQAATSRASKK